jgi:hypothetical protein
VLPLSRVFITIPVLALPLAALSPKPALAGELTAVQGLQILAKAQAADRRCHFLSAAEHDELASYQSRAEIASAGLMPPKEVGAAIADGKAQGKAAPCDETTRSDVTDTLTAARQAVASADHSAGRRPPRVASPDPVRQVKPSGSGGAVSLATYRGVLKPYFVDLRCHELDGRAAKSYWNAIVRLRTELLARYGKPAVSSAQVAARNSAAGVGCGAGARSMARQGLADIRNF